MRRIVLGFLLAAIACPALAQQAQVLPGGCGTASYGSGGQQLTMDNTGKLCDSGGGSSGNASVGTNAATAPTSSTQIGSKDSSGNLQPASVANPIPVQQVPQTAGATGGAVNGYNSATDTTSTQIIAAVAAKKIYLQGWSCNNSGTTSVTVTFQDGSAGSAIAAPIDVPAGGANNIAATGPAWGNTTAGNALYTAASGSTTTLTCGAIGFAQ
jgi:hypothetical protein